MDSPGSSSAIICSSSSSRRRTGAQKLLGYLQGQFRIRTDASGRKMAEPLTEPGVIWLRPEGRLIPAPQTMALDDFKRELRETAGPDGPAGGAVTRNGKETRTMNPASFPFPSPRSPCSSPAPPPPMSR